MTTSINIYQLSNIFTTEFDDVDKYMGKKSGDNGEDVAWWSEGNADFFSALYTYDLEGFKSEMRFALEGGPWPVDRKTQFFQDGIKLYNISWSSGQGVDLGYRIIKKKYDKIVISPGPGNPNQSGNCLKILKTLHKNLPFLGVCLGHQIIGQVFGSKIVQAKKLMHGKTSEIRSNGIGILKNLPKTFEATRYHSLIIEKKSLSKDLEITAETNDGLIMGVQHKKYNIHGVQFHPESIKTILGIKILKNFINS